MDMKVLLVLFLVLFSAALFGYTNMTTTSASTNIKLEIEEDDGGGSILLEQENERVLSLNEAIFSFGVIYPGYSDMNEDIESISSGDKLESIELALSIAYYRYAYISKILSYIGIKANIKNRIGMGIELKYFGGQSVKLISKLNPDVSADLSISKSISINIIGQFEIKTGLYMDYSIFPEVFYSLSFINVREVRDNDNTEIYNENNISHGIGIGVMNKLYYKNYTFGIDIRYLAFTRNEGFRGYLFTGYMF